MSTSGNLQLSFGFVAVNTVILVKLCTDWAINHTRGLC